MISQISPSSPACFPQNIKILRPYFSQWPLLFSLSNTKGSIAEAESTFAGNRVVKTKMVEVYKHLGNSGAFGGFGLMLYGPKQICDNSQIEQMNNSKRRHLEHGLNCSQMEGDYKRLFSHLFSNRKRKSVSTHSERCKLKHILIKTGINEQRGQISSKILSFGNDNDFQGDELHSKPVCLVSLY